MPRPPRLSPDQRAQARADYLSTPGITVDQLAERYGVGRTVMLRNLAGITRPAGGRRKPVATSELVSLTRQGYTVRQVAERTGLSPAGVSLRLRETA
jgi:hypothetical protein